MICKVLLAGALVVLVTCNFSAAIETQDLKEPETLGKMSFLWKSLIELQAADSGTIDRWSVMKLGSPEYFWMDKIPLVKNSSGDLLYMIKRKNNEIYLNFVSKKDILYFPPVSFRVDKKHRFDIQEKNVLPIVLDISAEYGGFSILLCKSYENPLEKKDLRSLIHGAEVEIGFFSVENEWIRTRFSLNGSKDAILQLLAGE